MLEDRFKLDVLSGIRIAKQFACHHVFPQRSSKCKKCDRSFVLVTEDEDYEYEFD
jgi:hypothetical protein